MRIIEIEAVNGGHRNQWTEQKIEVPEGWAVIPDDMSIPHTFPFVDIETAEGVVISMTAGTMPTPTPTPPDPPEDNVWDAIAEAIREGVNSVE